ncbi:MAG: NAD-dependent epimerase/dehydratase family protein, partial [Phycisphaerales bacterium]
MSALRPGFAGASLPSFPSVSPEPVNMPASDQFAHQFNGATVLITGGAGFIGSHIAHKLASLGARVRV